MGSLGLTSFGATILPVAEAGASNPASLNCGTLEVTGTDGNTYQFSEFTTGNATRGPNIDAGGAVAYGGNLAASNFTVAQNISPPATSLTALVGGNETGQLNLQKGSLVVAGTASGPANLNGGAGTAKTVGGGAGTIPFSFSSIGTALAGCSNNYGPNGTTTLGTVTQLNASLLDPRPLRHRQEQRLRAHHRSAGGSTEDRLQRAVELDHTGGTHTVVRLHRCTRPLGDQREHLLRLPQRRSEYRQHAVERWELREPALGQRELHDHRH